MLGCSRTEVCTCSFFNLSLVTFLFGYKQKLDTATLDDDDAANKFMMPEGQQPHAAECNLFFFYIIKFLYL